MCEYARPHGAIHWEALKITGTSSGPIIKISREALSGILWTRDCRKLLPPAIPFFAYGGDYGPKDVPSDNNFLCNGLFYPNRHPNPHAWEMKKVYQNIHTRWTGNNTVEIYNKNFFKNLSDVKMEWEIIANGIHKQSGEITDINVAPHQTGTVTLPLQIPAGGEEIFLNINYRLNQAEPLLDAGYIVAEEQLPGGSFTGSDAVQGAGKINVKEDDSSFTITSSAATIRFSKSNGFLSQYVVKKMNLLENGFSLQPCSGTRQQIMIWAPGCNCG